MVARNPQLNTNVPLENILGILIKKSRIRKKKKSEGEGQLKIHDPLIMDFSPKKFDSVLNMSI